MVFIYQAALYCDSCGEAIRASLDSEGKAPEYPDDEDTYDSDDYPKGRLPEGESDSPEHCAGMETCLEAIDLKSYGLAPDAPLHGIESGRVGAIVCDTLTEHGEAYALEMMAEPDPTPVQVALYALWREVFDLPDPTYTDDEDEDEDDDED
jgi:hypothetical protein